MGGWVAGWLAVHAGPRTKINSGLRQAVNESGNFRCSRHAVVGAGRRWCDEWRYGGGRVSVKRPRVLGRARVGWPRALRELKELLYEVYLAADAPSLDEITVAIATDDDLAGSPERDTVRRCISAPSLPAKQADAVSVATVLARRSAWDEQDLAARVRDLWVRARMAQGVGRPIGEFDDQLILADLEVHAALGTGDARQRFGALPTYLPREHDTRLETVVAAAAEAGRSGIAVLVGGSSTGKTRALWEAVRSLPKPWRLWHPISPSRPDAALADLEDVAPYTVVWLNEAQDYLAADPIGAQVAAGLRSLLHDPSRAPVLVLATLWPEHWNTLTNRASPDQYAHARELLDGHKIDVPDAFTPADLAALAGVGGTDPRLTEAAERAQDAQVTQYLAGVPVLMDRYNTAQGATRALIHAAMDARRLGAGPYIPVAWLADAAPGYLTESEWNAADKDWLTQALDYVTQECNGIPGILTPAKTTTRNQRNHRPATTTPLFPVRPGHSGAPLSAGRLPRPARPRPPRRPDPARRLLDRSRPSRPPHRPEHPRYRRLEPRLVPRRRPTPEEGHRSRRRPLRGAHPCQ